MSRSPLDLDDLVEYWTLLPDEVDLVVRRHGATRLLFAAWLKFTRHGRFPRGRSELHDDAVVFLARQLKVSAGVIGLVEWDGPAERHRADGGLGTTPSGEGVVRLRTRPAARSRWSPG
ncbi:DUF4158 domain-containing protein [Salinispora arenicola]|uniref:DUF4158 domain-containing protein n=1 Tax=Salinispora arenicola TaxID=168697 RepID=UPI0003763801|nr:DUF4158 domain-containing protein [Salinispora arenicola]